MQQSTRKTAGDKFDARSSLARLEMDLALIEGRDPASAAASAESTPSLPALPQSARSAAAAAAVSGPFPPARPMPPPGNASARGARFNRGSEQLLLERHAATAATNVRRSSLGAGGGSGSASASATPTGSRGSTPRRRDSFKETPLAPLDAGADDGTASVASSTSQLRSPRSGRVASKVDSGAVRTKPVKTAEERMAALDRLARQVSRMEMPAATTTPASAPVTASPLSSPAKQQQTAVAVAAMSSSSPGWRAPGNAMSSSSLPVASASGVGQKGMPATAMTTTTTEETFLWPEATAEENAVMSAPRGKMLERAGSGQYLFAFPTVGFFACRRCHCKVAACSNKVPAEGGYAAFAKYCAGNLRCDLIVDTACDMTRIAVACRSCLCNIGALHPLQGHLMAQSSSLVWCPVERGGPEWDKPDTDFAAQAAAEAAAARSPKRANRPPSAVPSLAASSVAGQRQDEDADEEEEEVDEDDESYMKPADRDSVLFG